MATDSCTTLSTPATKAASTTAAEPALRTRSAARHARRITNRLVAGIAVARVTTTSWPTTAALTADESSTDTQTGTAPGAVNTSAVAFVRASAVTVWPARTNAGTACPPIAPVPPVTNTLTANHPTTTTAPAKPAQRGDPVGRRSTAAIIG